MSRCALGRHSRTLTRIAATSLAAAATLAVTGCAATPTAGEAPAAKNRDPIEGFNRGVYAVNDVVDRHALRPVAVAYRDHTPDWFRTGVSNFFVNLFYPTTIANQFLQGKFKQGTQDIARFAINTTLGWGGVLDVASGARLPTHDEDFGQTLGKWGVPPGPYLMLPLLGPANLRDAPSRVADDFTQPFRWYNADNERYFSLAVYLIDRRADLLPLDRVIGEAYDPYAFVRDAYMQRREYAVHDGDVADAQADDDSNWAEEALREDEAAAAPGTGQVAAPAAERPAPDAAPGDAPQGQ
ncbi:MAG: MlaA family lipoprotein [Steroidobacteraceae bacterium]